MAKFHPFAVSIPHVIYACLGGFVVLFGMFSLFLREKLYIGEACWAFGFGIAIGPYGANILDPRGWSSEDQHPATVTLEFTRVVLAVGVFAAGVELPKAYMAKHWKSLLFLLGPVMTWGWFVSAAFIYALIPGLNFLSSLAIAACFTPTDPILAQAVIGGKYASQHVPAHIRHLIAAEAGCNDGAAYPFLYIALYLVLDNTNGNAIRDWFLLLWLYQITFGVLVGALIGYAFRHLMKFCEKRDLIDRHSYVAQYLALSLFTIGLATLLGTDDLLAAFCCGTAFAWDGFFNKRTEESVFSTVVDLLFNITAFIYVGAWMPFSSFQNADLSLSVWRLVVLAVLVLLFRRLPIMLILYRWIPDVKTFREALFTGHFGPMGIGAIYISTLAAQTLSRGVGSPPDQVETLRESIQPITAFIVLSSILIHGLSIPSFSLGRRIHMLSRTWSRQSSTNHLTDWTNQATLVTRPDQVVINHDREDQHSNSENRKWTPMERTDSGLSSQSHTFPAPRALGKKDTAVLIEGKRAEESSIVEWLEGPHKVIERHTGPGEEVEVEVIQNWQSPDADTSRFYLSHANVYEHLNTYLAKLSHTRFRNPISSRCNEGGINPSGVDAPAAKGPSDLSKAQLDAFAEDLNHSSQSLVSHRDINDTPLGDGNRPFHPCRNDTFDLQRGCPSRSDLPQAYASYDELRGRPANIHQGSKSQLDGIRALHANHYAHRGNSPSRSIRFREEPLPGRSSGTSTPKYSSVFRYGSPSGGESSVPSTPPPEMA
ncbi:hypothetical protein V5O48_007364 [Marasmius crinis-equi]|uniref:Cation/H+ exchanger transmembrane domain-containing protein n=1 Tax=Marasmius crinis-equi TaxID=585013 RepID=A0ABR3FHM4_9AGAR